MQYTVNFLENDGEYIGILTVNCDHGVKVDESDPRIFYADNVSIAIDEEIVSVKDDNGNVVFKG